MCVIRPQAVAWNTEMSGCPAKNVAMASIGTIKLRSRTVSRSSYRRDFVLRHAGKVSHEVQAGVPQQIRSFGQSTSAVGTQPPIPPNLSFAGSQACLVNAPGGLGTCPVCGVSFPSLKAFSTSLRIRGTSPRQVWRRSQHHSGHPPSRPAGLCRHLFQVSGTAESLR